MTKLSIFANAERILPLGSAWSRHLTDLLLGLASCVVTWLIMRVMIRKNTPLASQRKTLRLITLVLAGTLILSVGFDVVAQGFEGQVAIFSVLFIAAFGSLVSKPESRRLAAPLLGTFSMMLLCLAFAFFALLVLPRFGQRVFYWVTMAFAIAMILAFAYKIYRTLRGWSRRE